MTDPTLEQKLQDVASDLVSELISLTPETMSEIQFEIVGTPDGGADVGLLENHPAVPQIALSDGIYRAAGEYLPLVKQYIPNWQRSLMILTLKEDGWNVKLQFEQS